MRLPNSDRAVVADAKVRDYLLSQSHPVGRFKSSFFVALGLRLPIGRICERRFSRWLAPPKRIRAKPAHMGRSTTSMVR